MMVFLRVVAVFFTFIVIYCKSEIDSSTKTRKCNTCQPRSFLIYDLEECTCAKNQFCNETSGQCSNCGRCFDLWENATENIKGEIESTLKILLKIYEINLEELQNLIKVLSDKVKEKENILNKTNDLSDTIYRNISEIFTKIEKLRKKLEIIEENINTFKTPEKLDDILKRLRELQNKIQQWLKTLSKINTQHINNRDLLELKKKLTNISDFLKNVDLEIFSKLGKDALNLALATENNLDLVNITLTMKLNNNVSDQEFLNNVKNSMRWIESDLIYFIETLNAYFSPPNTTELLQNADKVRSSANATKSKLDRLLKDQENFEKMYNQLKLEHGNYTHIKELQQKLNAIAGDVKALDNLLKRWEGIKKLNDELNRYQEQLIKFKDEINKINRFQERMDTLLKTETELLEKFRQLKNIKTVSQVRNDINRMLKEVERITCEIIYRCMNDEERNATCKIKATKKKEKRT